MKLYTGMGPLLVILALLPLPFATHAAGYSIQVHVLTVHSQNGRYYLRSIPFDNELPSMRGVTRVYATGQSAPLYEFERGFDSVSEYSNNLILSDDGETIFYTPRFWAEEEREGLKSITIYRHGRIYRSYTGMEIEGCDSQEQCSPIYSNGTRVIDSVKSGMWPNYKKVFKDGVPEEEKFLSDFAIFASGDTVYLTDSKKRTHLFDLKEGALAASGSFDELYGALKSLARFTRVELESYEGNWFDGFPRLKGGGDTSNALARYLGMQEIDLEKSSDHSQYKSYEVSVRSNILRNGSLEVEDIEVEEGLPRDKIIEFFTTGRFDVGNLPAIFEKWHLGVLGDERFYFRKSDKRLARSERKTELEKENRLAIGASAVLHEDRLIHLDESGHIRAWNLRDGSFDAAATAKFALDDLLRLASDGSQLWAVGATKVYRWSSEDDHWKSAADFDQKRQPLMGFAVVDGAPLLVLRTGVLNAVTKRMYTSRVPPPLGYTVAVTGTESKLWIGTSQGEWGGSLYQLDPSTGSWAVENCGGYVTGITKTGKNEVIVSWSMSHLGMAHTSICRHRPDAKPQSYPELDSKYYQTVGFNTFDNTLYGVEQADLVTIADGRPTRIAALDGPVFGRERMAVGVAPGIGSLLPFAPGALIVVPKAGMPWLLSNGKLTRLTGPGQGQAPEAPGSR